MTTPADFYDEIAVSIVCDERVPMRLTGADRLEAVRRLSAAGLSASEIGKLCKVSGHTITNLMRYYGIPSAPRRPGSWWCAYIERRGAWG